MECAAQFLGAIAIMGIAIDEFTSPIRIKLDYYMLISILLYMLAIIIEGLYTEKNICNN